MEFPNALLGVALGTVLLPMLAQHHSDADRSRYSDLLDWGLRLALLLALPAALALWLIAVPLISTLYQYGKFVAADVWQVRAALLGYAVGLTALILVKILAPGFYARQNLKTPVKIAFVTVLVTQALALMLMWPLGHAGLTLATSLGACVNAGLLFTFLYRRGIYAPRAGWPGFVTRLLVAIAVLAAVLLAVAGPSAWWLAASVWEKALRLVLVIGAGGFAYFATLYLLGFRLADFDRREGDRGGATATVLPEE
jgi:putative peptidoglycan lipid II flippase